MKQVRRLAQPQPFQTSRQLACAFLAIGDTGGAARRAHILSHDPGQLEHQRLGLAAARAGQNDAMAGRIVSRLLARIASQIGRLGEICGG